MNKSKPQHLKLKSLCADLEKVLDEFDKTIQSNNSSVKTPSSQKPELEKKFQELKTLINNLS